MRRRVTAVGALDTLSRGVHCSKYRAIKSLKNTPTVRYLYRVLVRNWITGFRIDDIELTRSRVCEVFIGD